MPGGGLASAEGTGFRCFHDKVSVFAGMVIHGIPDNLTLNALRGTGAPVAAG